jgi:hypothetical protein
MFDSVRVNYKEGTHADGTFFVCRTSEVVPKNCRSATTTQNLYQEHKSFPGGPSADGVKNMKSSR